MPTNKIKLQFVCNCLPILRDTVVQEMADESTYTVEIRIVISKQGQERPSMGTTRAIQSDCTVIFYTANLMYACPCIGYKTYTSAQDYTPAPQNLSHNT